VPTRPFMDTAREIEGLNFYADSSDDRVAGEKSRGWAGCHSSCESSWRGEVESDGEGSCSCVACRRYWPGKIQERYRPNPRLLHASIRRAL
jgi:hypothetical protein